MYLIVCKVGKDEIVKVYIGIDIGIWDFQNDYFPTLHIRCKGIQHGENVRNVGEIYSIQIQENGTVGIVQAVCREAYIFLGGENGGDDNVRDQNIDNIFIENLEKNRVVDGIVHIYNVVVEVGRVEKLQKGLKNIHTIQKNGEVPTWKEVLDKDTL